MQTSTIVAWMALLLTVVATNVESQQIVCSVDLIFIVDESGSIRKGNPRGADPGSKDDNWTKILDFMNSLIADFNVGPDEDNSRVAVVTFGNNGKVHWNLDQYTDSKSELMQKVSDLPYRSQNTNTTGGFLEAEKQILGSSADRPKADNIIVLISDGNPTRMGDELVPTARRIKKTGAKILGVGVTDGVDPSKFEDVVSDPADDFYFAVDNFDGFSAIMDQLLNQACRNVTPPTPAPQPTPPLPTCENEVDLMMVVDVSGSIGSRNFVTVKQFVKDLSSRLDIDSGKVNMGLVCFSSRVEPMFPMDEFTSRIDVMEAVDTMQYLHGTTNTGETLRYLRETSFSSRRGNRDNVQDVIVLLTDGSSDDEGETLREAYQLKRMGVHIIVISVGRGSNMVEIESIASYPSDSNVLKVSDFDELDMVVNTIQNAVCNNDDDCANHRCDRGTCVDAIGTYYCECNSGFGGRFCDNRCESPADVAFALDISGSIRRKNFLKEIDFVRNIALGFNMQDHQISVSTFGNNADLRFPLNTASNKQQMMDALDNIHYTGGSTNTASVLSLMKNTVFASGNGARRNMRQVAIVLTDGKSDDKDATWQEAMALRDSGTFLLAIGVGRGVRQYELENIASAPHDSSVFRVEDFDTINEIEQNIIDAICLNNDPCRRDPCEGQGTCININGDYRCDCNEDYTGKNCEIHDTGNIDLAFVFDSSGSIRKQRFEAFTDQFADAIQDRIEVRPGKTQVAAVKWANKAEVEFHLNKYKKGQDVAAAIKQMAYMRQRTNTADALKVLREEVFTTGNGARGGNTRRVAIIATDGNSNIESDETLQEAIKVHMAGIQTIVLAIGDNMNMFEINGIASRPLDRNKIVIRSFREIPDVIDDVLGAYVNDEDDCRRDPCDNGARCLDEVGYYMCECRNDWAGRNCDQRCSERMDIALILDLSGSMEVTYNVVIRFAEEFLYGLPVAQDRVNVALISYTDEATLHFNLGDYESTKELMTALSFSNPGGKTNTADALEMAERNVFNRRDGDRTSIANKVVLITDGRSNVSARDTIRKAEDLKNNDDADIYVMALGENPDMREINEIASRPESERVLRLTDSSEVTRQARNLLDILCNN